MARPFPTNNAVTNGSRGKHSDCLLHDSNFLR
jgi:hypothetical protein